MEHSDYITYARYRVIRDENSKVSDLVFEFANENMRNKLGYDPTGMSRKDVLPIQDKMLKEVEYVTDMVLSKRFSYQCDGVFDNVDCMIEPDINDSSLVHIYTVDMDMLMKKENMQDLRNCVNTTLTMFGISVMHINVKEHYAYADSILALDFPNNADSVFQIPKIRDSRSLYDFLEEEQKNDVSEKVRKLVMGEKTFAKFDYKIKAKHYEEVIRINGYMIPEAADNMYMLSIQW